MKFSPPEEETRSLKNSRSYHKSQNSSTSKPRGPPKKDTTELLIHFQTIKSKPLEAKNLRNHIVRLLIRKFKKKLQLKDDIDQILKKLGVDFNSMNVIIDENACLKTDFDNWTSSLNRKKREEKRQYSHKEVKMLMNRSPKWVELYRQFAKCLLNCTNRRKREILSLLNWPLDGNNMMKKLMDAHIFPCGNEIFASELMNAIEGEPTSNDTSLPGEEHKLQIDCAYEFNFKNQIDISDDDYGLSPIGSPTSRMMAEFIRFPLDRP